MSRRRIKKPRKVEKINFKIGDRIFIVAKEEVSMFIMENIEELMMYFDIEKPPTPEDRIARAGDLEAIADIIGTIREKLQSCVVPDMGTA